MYESQESTAGKENNQKCIFLGRDGVLCETDGYILDPADLKLFDYTAETLRRINESEFLAVVVSNQSAVARGLLDEPTLAAINNKLEKDLGESGAALDAIYCCPHYDGGDLMNGAREFMVECDCRKPKAGMIMKAAGQFRINLHSSWMIGDANRDIQAGRAAGMRTIALRTGEGMVQSGVRPDFHFDHLADAVDYILNDPLTLYYEQIRKCLIGTRKVPFVVGVGGPIRSGKSTYVTEMMYRLSRDGVQCIRLPLDQWMLPDHEHGEKDIRETYRFDQLKSDLRAFFAGEGIEIPGYSHHPTRRAFPIQVRWAGEPVVFVEGIPALADADIAGLYHWKVLVDADDKQRKLRFERYSTWKGRTPEESRSLYTHYQKSDQQITDQGRALADEVVKL